MHRRVFTVPAGSYTAADDDTCDCPRALGRGHRYRAAGHQRDPAAPLKATPRPDDQDPDKPANGGPGTLTSRHRRPAYRSAPTPLRHKTAVDPGGFLNGSEVIRGDQYCGWAAMSCDVTRSWVRSTLATYAESRSRASPRSTAVMRHGGQNYGQSHYLFLEDLLNEAVPPESFSIPAEATCARARLRRARAVLDALPVKLPPTAAGAGSAAPATCGCPRRAPHAMKLHRSPWPRDSSQLRCLRPARTSQW